MSLELDEEPEGDTAPTAVQSIEDMRLLQKMRQRQTVRRVQGWAEACAALSASSAKSPAIGHYLIDTLAGCGSRGPPAATRQ